MSIKKNTPHFLKHAKKSFTTIQNKTIESIEDPAALGIYLYLASKPDDWEISPKNLMNRFKKGGDFIKARLAELKKIGLLEAVSIKNEKGQVVRWETVLHTEIPDKSPTFRNSKSQKVEKPPSGEHTMVEKPPTTNKRYIKIKDLNKPPISPKGGSERFEEFWSVYPVKEAKKACAQKWNRFGLDRIADEIIEKVALQLLNDRKWIAGFIPNPLTYINQERWNDELDMRARGATSKQQSIDNFHSTMAKYKKVPKDGYYDEHGNFIANYL